MGKAPLDLGSVDVGFTCRGRSEPWVWSFHLHAQKASLSQSADRAGGGGNAFRLPQMRGAFEFLRGKTTGSIGGKASTSHSSPVQAPTPQPLPRSLLRFCGGECLCDARELKQHIPVLDPRHARYELLHVRIGEHIYVSSGILAFRLTEEE